MLPADPAARAGDHCNLSLHLGHHGLLVESALTGERPSDDELLDLARAFVQRCHARITKILADRIFVHVAVTAVNLHRGLRGAHGGLAGVVLRDRELTSGVADQILRVRERSPFRTWGRRRRAGPTDDRSASLD